MADAARDRAEAPDVAPTTEATPLLRDSAADSEQQAIDALLPRRQILRIAIPLLTILTIVEFAAALCASGLAALVEGSLCRHEFPDVQDPYNDERCKTEKVQADLAWVIGMEMTVSVIPGLFMSIPYGIVADKFGPNIVMGMVWIGQFISEFGHLIICTNPQIFNVRWIYASSFGTLIGGGGPSFAAMRFLVAGSLVSEENRTTLFFYMQAYGNAIAFATGPVTYFVMSRAGPVWVQFTGAALIGLMAIPGFLLPHKLPNTPAVADSDTIRFNVRERVTEVFNTTVATLRRVFGHNLQLSLLLSGVMFTTLGTYETTFRLQYATKRFGWTWAQASLIPSVVSISNLTALVIILPALGYLMLRYNFTTLRKDLWLARFSAAMQVLGSFSTALAPTGAAYTAAIALYELCKGYQASMASTLVSVAKEAGIVEQTSVYACFSTMQSLGHVLAGPIMATAFRVGLRWGQAWYGLPFLAAGLLQLFTFCILFYVRQK